MNTIIGEWITVTEDYAVPRLRHLAEKRIRLGTGEIVPRAFWDARQHRFFWNRGRCSVYLNAGNTVDVWREFPRN